MNSSDENIIVELIARHLSGETSPEQEQQLTLWLEAAKGNRKLFEEYLSVWEKMDRVSTVTGIDIEAEWSLLESQMDESVPEINVSEGVESSKKPGRSASLNPTTKSRPSTVFIISRIAIAAVLVIALAFAGLYTSRNVGYRTLATAELPEDVVLPDGSTVSLNNHSSLRYPKKFNKEQRDVKLEGEGFFEVKGDPAWPFVITTTELDIRVLGTSFNVNAYESNTEIEVVVSTGEVAVTRHGEIPKTIILKPGSKAVYLKAEEDLKLSTKIDRNYLAWKTRSFVFEDESLADVSTALNKVYSSDIIIPSDSLKEAKITSSFHEQTLDAILNVLAATLDIEVVESGGQILLKESN